MELTGSQTGNERADNLVPFYGYQDSLSLDARGRFRAPDELAGWVLSALGNAQAGTSAPGTPVPPARLAFYFVPGPGKRIFLYPVTNIKLAVDRFENPPVTVDPRVLRDARDYFYQLMRYVEADKQNRFQIPEGLRRHAKLDENVERVSLVAHNHYLVLSPAEEAEAALAAKFEAFEQAADDLLDPIGGAPAPASDAGMTD